MINRNHIAQDKGEDEAEKLFSSLTAEAQKRLKDEITLDPTARGYEGNSFKKIAELLNKPADEDSQSRISVIFSGLAYAKNAVDANDVKEALK